MNPFRIGARLPIMKGGYIISPRVNGDGQERCFVEFVLGELGLDPLHVVRDDGANIEAVREQECNDEGGVRTFFRIRPIGSFAAREGEILHLHTFQRFTMRCPTLDITWCFDWF